MALYSCEGRARPREGGARICVVTRVKTCVRACVWKCERTCVRACAWTRMKTFGPNLKHISRWPGNYPAHGVHTCFERVIIITYY